MRRKPVFKTVLCLFFSVFVLFGKLSAQADNVGTWTIASLYYNVNNRVSLYAETQARSQSLTTDFYYHQLKGGVMYSFPRRYSAMIAFGNYDTYAYPGNYKGLPITKEWRLWEQFAQVTNIGRFKIEHRYRLEQRWVNSKYRNSFRYRLNMVVPINHAIVKPGTFSLTGYEEVFFTNQASYFERNRVFGGAGFCFSKQLTLQMGFLRQFDYRISDNGVGKNYLQFSLLFSAGKQNSQREQPMSSQE